MKIKRNFEEISLADIDFSNEYFKFAVGSPPEQLRESIKGYGILCPPILYVSGDGGKLVIVSGFGRLHVARELKITKLVAAVITQNVSMADLLMLALNERIGKRALNAAEQALVVSKAANIAGRENTIKQVMPLVGLEPSGKVFDQYLMLSGLERPLLNYLAENRISVQAALELCKVEATERLALAELLLSLGCSASIQKDVVVLCREIALREKLPVHEILADSEARQIMDNPGLNRRQKTNLLRVYLRKRRYPLLSKREAQFKQSVDELRLPPGVMVKPPPYFEGDRWSLEVGFRDEKELASKLKKIDELVASGRFVGVLR